MSMKTYSVLYAEDVPHYAFGDVEAKNDKSAIAKARRMKTDSFCAYEPDWDRAYCRRIVHIEAPDGTLIAEDIRLDPDEPQDQAIRTIAKDILRLETLELRNSDSLDFHERSVLELRDALEAAYDAGAKARAA